MARRLRADRATARQQAAEKRTELRGKLSPSEQLARLDQRLGEDIGARKERARLQTPRS